MRDTVHVRRCDLCQATEYNEPAALERLEGWVTVHAYFKRSTTAGEHHFDVCPAHGEVRLTKVLEVLRATLTVGPYR